MSEYTNIDVIDEQESIRRLKALPRPWAKDYLAMYSSWLEGITIDPWLMSVPLDDHLVHRGDGVFEAAKCMNGRIYQFDRHLDRLAGSALAIRLDLPATLHEIKQITAATVRAGGHADCMVRIYISRGPGGFTTNPFECPKQGVYVMVSHLHPPSDDDYEHGITMGLSRVPAKSGFYAAVKSCNYLPNVLLKREAVSKGWKFAVGVNEMGNLTEGSTENFGLVDQAGVLRLPEPENILEGTTVRRCVELAQGMIDEGLLAGVDRGPLPEAELASAREVMFFGTTLDVLPACRIDDRPVADGQPGPVARELLKRIRRDVLHGHEHSTPTGLED